MALVTDIAVQVSHSVSKEKQERRFFLFSDCLMYAKIISAGTNNTSNNNNNNGTPSISIASSTAAAATGKKGSSSAASSSSASASSSAAAESYQYKGLLKLDDVAVSSAPKNGMNDLSLVYTRVLLLYAKD